MNSITSLLPSRPPPPRAGKAPMALPLPIQHLSKQNRKLAKQTAAARKKLASGVYDTLDDLSEDEDSDSQEEGYASLETDSQDEEDEDEEEGGPDISASLSSDDEDSEERSQAKKRKASSELTPSYGQVSKQPRTQHQRDQFAEARARCEQMELAAEKELFNQENVERLAQLNNTIVLNLTELERVNDTILANTKHVQEEIARLEEKERNQVEDRLFVNDHEKIKKDLEAQQAEHQKRLAALEKQEALVLERSAATTVELEEKLAASVVETERYRARATELENRERTIVTQYADKEKAMKVRIAELQGQLVEQETEFLDREKQRQATYVEQEKAFKARVTALEKKAVDAIATTSSKPVNPLEGFLSEMHRMNQHTISREDMVGLLPQQLLNNLAYLGSKQPLKYNSVVNGQYLILEVSADQQLLMRQIVSKQLYNTK